MYFMLTMSFVIPSTIAQINILTIFLCGYLLRKLERKPWHKIVEFSFVTIIVTVLGKKKGKIGKHTEEWIVHCKVWVLRACDYESNLSLSWRAFIFCHRGSINGLSLGLDVFRESYNKNCVAKHIQTQFFSYGII